MNFKGDFFLGHPVCKSRLQKKKSGVKKCLEIMAIGGGGGVNALWQKPSYISILIL